MKEVKIKDDIKSSQKFETYNQINYQDKNEKISLKIYYFIYLFLLTTFILSKLFDNPKQPSNNTSFSFVPYLNYISNCSKLRLYKRTKIKNPIPFVSVCLPVFNMAEFIEKAIFSIINQSFQDFEIIIVNDCSDDKTEDILKRLKDQDDRIKIINHTKKLGVYASRMDALLSSKAKYIIFMDPDDMFMNEDLFKELYDYNLKNNLDIIEFSVFHINEGSKQMYSIKDHRKTHYHKFSKDIIHQPELSDILFLNPETKKYSHTICRNIWNKLIRKEVLINTMKYIGNDYYKNQFVITADDMLLNIISYHYANNYSNINLPGYLYTIRNSSMSRGDGGIELSIIRSINHLLYFKIFLKYLKEFNKDRNFLFYELKELGYKLFTFKDFNVTKYKPEVVDFYNEIIVDSNATNDFKKYASDLMEYYK